MFPKPGEKVAFHDNAEKGHCCLFIISVDLIGSGEAPFGLKIVCDDLRVFFPQLFQDPKSLTPVNIVRFAPF